MIMSVKSIEETLDKNELDRDKAEEILRLIIRGDRFFQNSRSFWIPFIEGIKTKAGRVLGPLTRFGILTGRNREDFDYVVREYIAIRGINESYSEGYREDVTHFLEEVRNFADNYKGNDNKRKIALKKGKVTKSRNHIVGHDGVNGLYFWSSHIEGAIELLSELGKVKIVDNNLAKRGRDYFLASYYKSPNRNYSPVSHLSSRYPHLYDSN
jgi:hypothetical protein